MKTREIMTEPAVTVPEHATLGQIALLMSRNRIDAVAVVGSDGKLRGTVSVSDFIAKPAPVPSSMLRLPKVFGRWLPKQGVERVYREARSLTASDVMKLAPTTVTPEDSVEEVLRQMAEDGVEMVPVVRHGVPAGSVTRHDLLRMMLPDPDSRIAERPLKRSPRGTMWRQT